MKNSIRPVLYISVLMIAFASIPSFRAFAAGNQQNKQYAADGSEGEEERLIRVYIDGTELTDAGAYFLSGRLMVPAIAAAKAMGAQTKWNPETREIFIYLYGRYVWMQTGNPVSYYGEYSLDAAGGKVLTSVNETPAGARPEITNRTVYIPAARLAEALGGYTAWIGAADTALIMSPPPGDVPSIVADNDEISAENIPAKPGHFRLLTSAEITGKYEADEPAVIFLFDSRADIELLAGILKISTALKFTFYGLDISANDVSGIPFINDGYKGGPAMCFAAGYKKPAVFLSELTLDNIYKHLADYWKS